MVSGGLGLFLGIKIFFGIEILHSVVRHRDRLLHGKNLCMFFWASISRNLEVKEDLNIKQKIEKSRYQKKTSGYQLKESPVFYGVSRRYRAICCKMGVVSQRCACVNLSTKRGVSHHFGGTATLPLKVSRARGYRSDSIAISRDMGPLPWGSYGLRN